MPVFENTKFLLAGRLVGGNHEQITKEIEGAGGQVIKQWAQTDYVISDNLPGSKTALADDFRNKGGQVVSTSWLRLSLEKGVIIDDASSYTDLSVTGPTLSVSQPMSHVPAISCKKRSRDNDDEPRTGGSTSSASHVVDSSTTFDPAKRTRTAAQADPSVGSQQQKKVASDNAPTKLLVEEHVDLGSLDVPLDICYSGHYTDEVLVDDVVWDVTLNHTDIEKNNNKFYVIQLIKSRHGYYCFTRWGRTGGHGQQKMDFCAEMEEGKALFRKKFRDKSKCSFDDRAQAQYRKGAYMFIQKEYGRKADSDSNFASSDKTLTASCSLPSEVQAIVQLIMNLETMKQQILAMGLNVDEIPLGKLNKKQISMGYQTLTNISNAIKDSACSDIFTDLCSTFYTLIPHKTYGRERPAIISTEEAVKSKFALLQSLEELRVGTKLLEEAQGIGEALAEHRHPLDVKYEKLRCEIRTLPRTCKEHSAIERYVDETHNNVHGKPYHIKVETIYTLKSFNDERFTKHEKEDNRQLLWHSSRLGNFAGILSQGLRIAPPEAPASGLRLGKGIYFADSLKKSSTYCWATEFPSSQCLLLCEVALGKQKLHYADDVRADHKLGDHSSSWAVGWKQNDPAEHVEFAAGLKLPSGALIEPELSEFTSFEHNEFVVYDPARVRPRFLVLTTFEKA